MDTERKGGFMSRLGTRRPTPEAIGTLYGDKKEPSPPETLYAAPANAHSPSGSKSADREMNVFTEGLTIEGNVISETGIVIRGTVRGSIACRADVEISGEITGDVEGKNVRITGGGVEGNITAGEMLSIDRSRIKGNLSATHARINTSIEGDISVHGTLTLQREAAIRGNITAAGMSVEEGASMNGLVTISREVPAPAPRSGSGAARTRNSDETKASVAVTLTADAGRVSDGRLPLAGAEDPAGEKTQRS